MADTALARVEPSPQRMGLMRPVVRPAEIIEAHKEAADVIREALEDGRDYGTIPNAGPRKVLLKAGAERLCVAFGLRAVYSVVSSEADHDREVGYYDYKRKKDATSRGLYRFIMKCELMRDGVIAGEGIGSCSTMESKYVSRPRDCENTALKMAKKRALVDAVLATLSLSDRFTQDVGDTENDDEDDTRGERPTAPKMNQAELVAEVTAAYDALGVAEKDRKAETQRILGRKADSLQDLVVVRDTLRETLAMRDAKPVEAAAE
ncbi:MAG: hypothetical protein EBR82_56815 [Caulobacteraceae bacterium]|nr:hypothetical protein [Caulobacteraceae bacterium]